MDERQPRLADAQPELGPEGEVLEDDEMTDRTNDGPKGGRTLAGDLGPTETTGGGPMGEQPIDAGGGTGTGVTGGAPTGATDLPEHADEPEVVGGPGDGPTAERPTRA